MVIRYRIICPRRTRSRLGSPTPRFRVLKATEAWLRPPSDEASVPRREQTRELRLALGECNTKGVGGIVAIPTPFRRHAFFGVSPWDELQRIIQRAGRCARSRRHRVPSRRFPCPLGVMNASSVGDRRVLPAPRSGCLERGRERMLGIALDHQRGRPLSGQARPCQPRSLSRDAWSDGFG